MTQVPAGWYPDPATQDLPGPSARQRYWDGSTWTEHQHDMLKATPDGQILAEWWQRAVAHLLDTLILMALGLLAFIPIVALNWETIVQDFRDSMRAAETQLVTPTPAFLEPGSGIGLMLLLSGLLISMTYTLGFWRYKQATPGKMVMGLRLRRRDAPGSMPWSTMLVRYAVVGLVGLTYGIQWLYWLLSLALFVNYLWPLWDSKNQAIHDKIARTNVVRAR